MKSTQWKIVLSDYAGGVDRWAQELKIEFPFYMQTYTEALNAVLKNVSYNRQMYQEKKKRGSVFIGAGSEYFGLDESNIFAFIGERGSGKSTALFEFCRILHDYSQNQKIWRLETGFQAEQGGDRYCFRVLEPIDASVLGAKEDLLEVILANMYQVFQEKVKANKETWSVMGGYIQDLSKCFDAVYKAYVNMGNLKEQKASGEAVLAKLMNTSNSLKIKAEMERLVENFLFFLDREENEDKSYLVVTIDDLDLNLQNGYEMLEQLHKYLANQRVIILITIKYEQMKMICENYIVDCLVPEFGGIHKTVYDKFDSEAGRISNDYLLKVLPLANRIYMPVGNLMHKKALILSTEQVASGGSKIKEFVLKKIALQMNIFYDAKGLKKHFCLPDTVRELVFYDNFLDSLIPMKQIEGADKDGQRRWLYDLNHERFNEDIEVRMAFQILEYGQRKLFHLIVKRDIKRRAEYTVNFLLSWIECKSSGQDKDAKDEVRKKRADKDAVEKDKAEKDISGNDAVEKDMGMGMMLYDGSLCLRDIVDERNYCYADLLEVLYRLGRVDYNDKPLVHCLLASFTSEMVREYYSYMYGNAEDRKESRECLKALLGKTFGGKWFDGDSVRMEVSKTFKETDGAEKSEKGSLRVGYIGEAVWGGEREIRLKKYVNDFDGTKENRLIEWLSECVPCMECLTLCFSDFKSSEGRAIWGKWSFELRDGKDKIELSIKNSAQSAVFDAFGFIGKEIIGWGDGGKDITEIHQELLDALLECVKEYYGSEKCKFEKEKDQFLDELAETAKKKSIFFIDNNKGLEHEGKFSACAFPYYSLDMSYNVMKRVRRKIKGNTNLKENNIYNYYRTIYGYIAEELWKEQDYFEKLLENDTPKFYDNFINFPFIRAFGVQCDDERLQREKVLQESEKLSIEGLVDPNLLDEIFYHAVEGLSFERGLDEEIKEQVTEG